MFYTEGDKYIPYLTLRCVACKSALILYRDDKHVFGCCVICPMVEKINDKTILFFLDEHPEQISNFVSEKETIVRYLKEKKESKIKA